MGKHDRRETSGQPPDSRPVTIQVPLPVLGVVHGIREAFHGLCIATGLQVLEAMMEADRAVLCGPKGRHQVERPAWRGGSVESPVTLGGRQVEVPRLRVRSADGEVPLVSFQWAAVTDPLDEHTLAAVAAGVSTRRYAGTLDPVPVDVTERATSSSAVSRRFVALSTKRLEAFLGRPLGELDLRVVCIDGKVFRDHCMVIALGIDTACSASITLAARVASFENATGLPQKDRTRAFRFGLGSGARGPGRSRWSPPGQPAGGVAPASWSSLATSAAISFRASIAIGNPKAFRGDAVGSAKRRRRAARRRQSRTRRCKVRSWPGRNTPGCSRQRRSKSSFAVRCGSVSSHWTNPGPARLERILPGAPVSGWSLASPMGRPHLAGAPCEREAPQEPVEVGVTFRHRMDRRPRGEGGEMMLDGPNLVQQRERVHRNRAPRAAGPSSQRESRPTPTGARTASPAHGSASEHGRRGASSPPA